MSLIKRMKRMYESMKETEWVRERECRRERKYKHSLGLMERAKKRE